MSASLIPELLTEALQRVNLPTRLWLVGGAVRDHFLQRETTDFDLVSAEDSLNLSRRLADAWSGAYYTLDRERQTGRALIPVRDQKLRIDIAKIDKGGIESDLGRRDFTVNALGVRIDEPDKLIDPTGGLRDLKGGVLRACAQDAIAQDPLRAVRAARLASELGFRIDAATQAKVRDAAHSLNTVSGERRREELFRVLQLDRPASTLRILQHLELLEPSLLPGARVGWLDASKGLDLVEALVQIIDLLATSYDPEGSASMVLAEASLKLGRYRPHLIGHFNTTQAADRTRRGLSILGALVLAGASEANGELSAAPARLIHRVAEELRLSNREMSYFQDVRSSALVLGRENVEAPSPLAIYRHFSRLGENGIDAIVLWLAQGLSGSPPDQNAWKERVEAARAFMAAWYDGEGVDFSAPARISGDELIAELSLSPGPIVGELLADVREALALGVVSDRHQALELARQRLRAMKSPEGGGC